MPNVLLARVEAVWPVNGTEAASSNAPVWVWIGLALLGALVVGGVVSYFGWRDRRRHTPEQRAFRALARRLRIRGRARAALEDLARRTGMPPVALLVSERAFREAAGAVEPSGPLARARERIFGER